MSEDNVIKLRHDVTRIDHLPEEEQNRLLIEYRDEMLEMLDGLRGRIMAFDLRAIVLIGFTENKSEDLVFRSSMSSVDPARTIGSLEFLKHEIMADFTHAVALEDDED